jgi:hypothetical protein
MQYPAHLEAQYPGQTGNLNASKLRKMGVEFARKQIDTCGQYASEILGYIDSDRREYNRSFIEPIEQNMRKDSEKIKKSFQAVKAKKLSNALYEMQKKEHKNKYKRILDKLKKTVLRTDEEFLNSAEKDGFHCSTLHLFALSILLKLPIYVKEQQGVKNHDTQQFNPTQSTEPPIHLYRVGNLHYQYIFYPKS